MGAQAHCPVSYHFSYLDKSQTEPSEPDELRISSRAETPFDSDPPTPRDPTPTPSELGMPYAASETGSTTTDNTTQHNRNKTKLNRLGAQDQSAELRELPVSIFNTLLIGFCRGLHTAH